MPIDLEMWGVFPKEKKSIRREITAGAFLLYTCVWNRFGIFSSSLSPSELLEYTLGCMGSPSGEGGRQSITSSAAWSLLGAAVNLSPVTSGAETNGGSFLLKINAEKHLKKSPFSFSSHTIYVVLQWWGWLLLKSISCC